MFLLNKGDKMRAAVYTGTRNLYESMIGAAKSLLTFSDVDQIYFLIEDDVFPYELPPKTITINISNQTYFPSNGPNFRSRFTYMALIRAALTKVFPDLDKILSLDVDTIVNENISILWDIDLGDNYFAAAKELIKSVNGFFAINAGVMMMNLKQLREDGKDDEVINAVNTKYYKYDIQDAYAEYCQGRILELSPEFNMNNDVDYKKAKFKRIIHYAGIKGWQDFPLFKYYRDIPNNKLKFNQYQETKLDIIVPCYNDKEGLIRTLASIYNIASAGWVDVTIVDDASTLDYTDIKKQFPYVNIIYLNENKGPGNARKVGIQNTHNDYIMFVDCGDVILSKWCFYAIEYELKHNRVPEIYEWPWINEDSCRVSKPFDASTPGKIYQRRFIESYGIYPCSDGPGSYAAEDCGFNLALYTIISNWAYDEGIPHIQHYDLPIYKTVTNQNSLTYKNNKEFWYVSTPGIVQNAIKCVNDCARNNVRPEFIVEKTNLFFIDMYRDFLRSLKRPELTESNWTEIRRFYLEAYKPYENIPENDIQRDMYYKLRLKSIMKYTLRPNILRFIAELNENETCPDKYKK